MENTLSVVSTFCACLAARSCFGAAFIATADGVSSYLEVTLDYERREVKRFVRGAILDKSEGIIAT